MSHLGDALFDWVIGALVGDDADAVSAHVEGCSACRAEVDALQGDLAWVALSLPPEPASPALLARVLGTVRYLDVPAVARHFDLPESDAAALLTAAEDETVWVPGKHGARLFHFTGGPAMAGADCGFARFAPTGGLPPHRHPGDERVLVLRGVLEDAAGRQWKPGDSVVFPAGETHAFSAGPQAELWLAVAKMPAARG